MKRIMGFFSVMLVLLVVGCSKDSEEKTLATVKPSEQSDMNKNILDSLGLDKLAMYDIEIYDSSVKYVEYSVEHYKNGESQGNITGAASSVERKEEDKVKKYTVSFAKTRFELDDNTHYERWNASLADKGGNTGSQSKPIKVESNSLSEAYTGTGNEFTAKLNKPIILGVVVRHDGNSISLPNSIFEDDKELKKFVSKYKEVFLYRIMLTESVPN